MSNDMKRIISMILAFAVVFSMAVPAGAAAAGEPDNRALELMRETIREEQKPETQAEQELPAADEIVELIVELESASGVELAGDRKAEDTAKDARLMDRVHVSQESCISEIKKINPQAEISRRYGLLFNGFCVKTRYGDKEKIEKLPGVTSVVQANTYSRSMANSREITGVNQVVEDYGYDGREVVVAVVDSGIDYNHKDMVISDGVPVRLEKSDVDEMISEFDQPHGRYFTEKVPYGYNYADQNNDIIDRAVDDPAYDHGMIVSGIIGANCQSEEEIERHEGARGMAPECQILMLKIFSNNSVGGASEAAIIAAIEDAVALGADVINLSIGLSSGFHNPEDGQQKAIKAAREAGVIVVAAAGNGANSNYIKDTEEDTDNYHTLIDTETVAEPGLTEDTIQVASMDNDQRITYQLSAWVGGTKRETMPYVLSDFDTKGLTEQYPVEYCGLGRLQDLSGKDLRGKIALVKRGEIEFREKKLNVQEYGAVAAIIYNSKGQEDLLDNISTDDAVAIPTVFMRNSDGELLRKYCSSGLKVSFEDGLLEMPSWGAGMSYFSSWGPVSDLSFKPDVTGVGGNVWCTVSNNGYKSASGTSMSCPNVAGIAALMVQHMQETGMTFDDPGDKTTYVKNTMMNTAHVLTTSWGEAYSPRKQGAGAVAVADAIKNDMVVTCNGDPYIELKAIDGDRTVQVELYNRGDESVTYTTGAMGPNSDNVKFDRSEVTVAPGGTETVSVTIRIGKNQEYNHFIEGFIRFTPDMWTSDAVAVGLPFMGFYGDWAGLQILDDPMYEETCVYGVTSLYTGVNYGYLMQMVPLGDGHYPDQFAINPSDPDSYCNVIPEVSFLRNARDVIIDVTNEKGEVIKVIDQMDYVRKEVAIEQSVLGKINFDWMWTGTYYDKFTGKRQSVDEGQYYINIRARADYDGAEEQILTMPVKIDKTAPTVAAETAFTEAATCQLRINAEDAGVVSSGIKSFVFLVDGQKYADADGKSVFTLRKSSTGEYIMNLRLPEESSRAIHTVDIGVTDYANNISAARTQVVDTSASSLMVRADKRQYAVGEAIGLSCSWTNGADTSNVAEYRIYLNTLSNLVGTAEGPSYTLDKLLPMGLYTVIVQAVDREKRVIDTNCVEVSVGMPGTAGQLIQVENLTDSTALRNGATFTARIRAANLGDQANGAALIVCLYDEQMRMVDCVATERKLAPKAAEYLSGTLTIPDKGRYTAKVMVWNSLDSMESLIPHMVVGME